MLTFEYKEYPSEWLNVSICARSLHPLLVEDLFAKMYHISTERRKIFAYL